MSHYDYSIILPSRGRSELFRHCCESIFFNASKKESVEVICRIDDDEPQLAEYAKVARDFRSHNCRVVLVVGPRLSGYGSNHVMIEEAASLSSGALIIQFNDDMEYETKGWDEIYINVACDSSFKYDDVFVITSYVSTPMEGRGGGYRYSAPVVTRRLYELCGEYALGQDPSVDRCWDALMRHLGREIHTDEVHVNHNHVGTLHSDQTANEGCNPFYIKLCQNIEERWARHEQIGKEFAEKVRRTVKI